MIDPDVYGAATSQTVPLFNFLSKERYDEVARWAETTGSGEHPAWRLLKAMRHLDDALVGFVDAAQLALLEVALDDHPGS
jgi:hypothetical protein